MNKYTIPPQHFDRSKPTLLSRSAKNLANKDVSKFLPTMMEISSNIFEYQIDDNRGLPFGLVDFYTKFFILPDIMSSIKLNKLKLIFQGLALKNNEYYLHGEFMLDFYTKIFHYHITGNFDNNKLDGDYLYLYYPLEYGNNINLHYYYLDKEKILIEYNFELVKNHNIEVLNNLTRKSKIIQNNESKLFNVEFNDMNNEIIVNVNYETLNNLLNQLSDLD